MSKRQPSVCPQCGEPAAHTNHWVSASGHKACTGASIPAPAVPVGVQPEPAEERESPYSMADLRQMRDEPDGNERGPLPSVTAEALADWLAANREFGSSLALAELLEQHLIDLGWRQP